MPTEQRVCVIGAGPAGLAMGRALLSVGVAFDIFERNPGVGGIWNPDHIGSPMYQSAHFISSKGSPTSTFRDYPFPPGTAAYPSHRDVRAYLEAFATSSGLMPHIQLSCGVLASKQIVDGWIVHLADGRTAQYSDLVCASGTLWDPLLPDLPKQFVGHVRHSVSYRTSDEVARKTVLVIGAGNSGVDIACDAARSAKRVLLSMRRGYWFVPKFIRGMPTDIFFRTPNGLPDWVHPPDAASLLEMLVGKPSAYGLPEPDHAPFTSHPIMNSDVLHHIGHGRIEPRRAVVDALGSEIEFADGTCDKVDEVICATGYRASLPYLEPGLVAYQDGNRPDLWMRIFHKTIPNLFCLGFIETNSSVYRLFDLGAELIAAHIQGRAGGHVGSADLSAAIAHGVEPDLSGGISRIASARHQGYVDSRAYERALTEVRQRHFPSTVSTAA